ncbi:porin [Labrys neptuniae]|uniref:Porin n=1 Tax=Labrys neptuniae TaxID=376174 RepID=A0ABV3PUG5_9HYPH
MTMKSLLLGAAAGIAAISTAQAADLPMTKGEAVEYVKVCSAFGPGFFYIPGSDTCLKIGGEIRADYRVFGGNGFSRNDDRSAFNTQARVWFDARTETDWGLLRSYFQINADSHPISSQGRGGVYNSNTFSIDKAFIQFGGLTAGYAHSFFGFYDNDYGSTIWAPYYAETSTVNLIAYTAQFGGGFSATLSIEDGRDHKVDNGIGVDGLTTTGLRGGQQVPDIVGQLRWDQSWGAIAVQAAAHQSRTAETVTYYPTGTDPLNAIENPIARTNKWGYAVGATGLIKLPFIDGGHFIVEGQYADGATEYLGANNTFFAHAPGDLFVDGTNGAGAFTVDRAKGWSIVAELGGNITPVLNANLVGSYIDTKSDNFIAAVDTHVQEYVIAGNLTYTIVKGLTIGTEVSYIHSKLKNGLAYDADAETVNVVNDSVNAWQFGVRLKRVF